MTFYMNDAPGTVKTNFMFNTALEAKNIPSAGVWMQFGIKVVDKCNGNKTVYNNAKGWWVYYVATFPTQWGCWHGVGMNPYPEPGNASGSGPTPPNCQNGKRCRTKIGPPNWYCRTYLDYIPSTDVCDGGDCTVCSAAPPDQPAPPVQPAPPTPTPTPPAVPPPTAPAPGPSPGPGSPVPMPGKPTPQPPGRPPITIMPMRPPVATLPQPVKPPAGNSAIRHFIAL